MDPKLEVEIIPVDLKSCSYETKRILVREWHGFTSTEWPDGDLPGAVCTIMTPKVTFNLPPPWQGEYTKARADEWIQERDGDGVTLLAVTTEDHAPIGLVIVHGSMDNADFEVHLGYMLAEPAWGRGLGTELVRGFVEWADKHKVARVKGGVSQDNIGSQRVLEKNGFVIDPDATNDDIMYVWHSDK